MIYVSYAGGDDKGNRTTVARGFLRNNRIEDLEAILEGIAQQRGILPLRRENGFSA